MAIVHHDTGRICTWGWNINGENNWHCPDCCPTCIKGEPCEWDLVECDFCHEEVPATEVARRGDQPICIICLEACRIMDVIRLEAVPANEDSE